MLMHKNIITVPKEIVDNIMDVLVDDVAKEIDFSVMADNLVSCGWSIVDLPPFNSNYTKSTIVDWAYEHCQGSFEYFGVRYIFENKEDALLFRLKWL